MDKEDLKKAMQQAQEMQLGLLQIQDELARVDINGFSKNKLVQIVMNGQGDTKSVQIRPELLALKKTEIENAIFEAIQDATRGAAKLAQEKMMKISKGLGT